MRLQILRACLCTGALHDAFGSQSRSPGPLEKSVRLESLTWQEAEPVLTPETPLSYPVGAASKEHGPHLKLRNDLDPRRISDTRVVDATPLSSHLR